MVEMLSSHQFLRSAQKTPHRVGSMRRLKNGMLCRLHFDFDGAHAATDWVD